MTRVKRGGLVVVHGVMGDLVMAFVVMVALACGSAAAGVVVGRRWSKRRVVVAVTAATLCILVYLAHLRDSYLLTRLLPVATLPIYADWLPVFAAFIAGLAWVRSSVQPGWRKAVLLGPVVALSLYGPARAITNEPPPCRDRWDRGVCRQTTSVSCVPAAAATLLAHYGVAATEPELAELCLTTWKGTHLFGLYRGLAIKGRGAGLAVRIEQGTMDDLRALNGPAILCMKLTRELSVREPQYAGEWGWVEGVMHTVVFYGFEEGGRKAVIGDPGAGRERWSVKGVEDLWTGEMVRLETGERPR